MFYLFHRRHFFYYFVITGPQEAQNLILFTLRLNSGYDLISFFPFMNQTWNKINRILKITAHRYGTISCCLTNSVKRRIKLSEIFCIEDGFNLFIPGTDLFQLLPRSISRIIINKYQFIIIFRKMHTKFINYGLTYRNNIIRFIKPWNNDTDFFH